MKFNYQQLSDLHEAARLYEEQTEAVFQQHLDAADAERAGFVCDVCNDTAKSALFRRMRQEIAGGTRPSEFIATQLDWLFGSFIHKRRRAAVLYAADACPRWAFARDYSGRRSYRTADMGAQLEHIRLQLLYFIDRDRVDRDALDILRGEVGEAERAYLAKARNGLPSYVIAYEIDSGNEAFIDELREAIFGNAAANLDERMILGIFQSRNAELHGLLGKLLLAARLQEGLRQAICEQADMGTIEGMAEIMRVIHENGLIRYSSVKRALGVWTGLIANFYDCRAADLERISAKTEELAWAAFSDPAARASFVESEDGMQIHLGLWAYGVHELADAVSRITRLAQAGTPHQVLTASYTAGQFCEPRQMHLTAASVLSLRREPDIFAAWLPAFMADCSSQVYGTSLRDAKNNRRPVRRLNQYFADRAEAERAYGMLLAALRSIKGKAAEFKPCIFPWHAVRLEKYALAYRLGWIASALDDDAKVDEVLDFLNDADYYRKGLIALLLAYPQTEKQRCTLIERLCDKQEDARKMAAAAIKTMELTAAHYRLMEDMLRYKNADMRATLIGLLMKQGDAALETTVARLLADKKEEKRSAALDIILQLGKDENRKPLYERCQQLTAESSLGSTKEKILAEQIAPAGAGTAPPPLYDEGDTYAPVPDKNILARAKQVFERYFYHQGLKDKLLGRKPDFAPVNEKMLAFMQEHADDEFKPSWGDTCTLSTGTLYRSWNADGSYSLPLAELWDGFYAQEIQSPILLLRAFLALVSEGDYDECSQLCDGFVKRLIGAEFTGGKLRRQHENMAVVYRYLLDKYGDAEERMLIAVHVAHLLAQEKTLRLEYRYKPYSGGMRRGASSLLDCHAFKLLLNPFREDEACGSHFALRYLLERVPGSRIESSGWDSRSPAVYLSLGGYGFLSAADYVRAAYQGDISERFMYRCLMEALQGKDDRVDALYFLSRVAMGEKDEREKLGGDPALPAFARRVYEKLTAAVLWEELRRGDSPTRFSRAVFRLGRVEGAATFAHILAALGREPLSRERGKTWAKDDETTKARCLSHLLEVCVPAEGDSAATLAAALKGTDVGEARLIEAAMYAPAWLGIIEEHLQWPGLKAACLYFMAHTSADFDQRQEALIARYTPLGKEELNAGAFELPWFRSAHGALGEKRFELVYKAAKYSADGARHTRARKYADAATGKLDAEATREEIAAKRNKDLLMAYALIPLKDEADLLGRYLAIRQFLKESRQFGAQRMASEKLAAEMALRNLATNAGLADVTRLALRMETKLMESTRPLLEDKAVGEYVLRLDIDAQGRAAVLCSKGGKALKSVPAALKKDAYVMQLADTKKAFNEQQSRTRQMLEQSMEDGTEYAFGELAALRANPVVAPLLRHLVWVAGEASGFLTEGGLVDAEGGETPLAADAMLRVAHPFDLYAAKSWAAYQRGLFERGTVQPFKQVFRELYVKTPEEADACESRRYAGYQVQPAKAAACLKARRWVADYEEGLQRVCYREDIVVRLYAQADWFTPSDIEAPAIEWVAFSDRRTGRPLAIREVPDRLFSEIMRDVDLAVSVAHAGGVDPETSHSTIGMRAALLRFTLPLFKLTNVELKGSHAHIAGTRADYTLHLGSGVVHQKGGTMLSILPVHGQHKGKLFLPFADDDPKTAEIISKVLLLAEDGKLRDPAILRQLNR